MKKTILFMFMLSLSLILVAQTAVEPDEGDGSVGSPYEIATLGNLYWIADDSGRWDSYYVQTADIDASDTENWTGGGWVPIGNATTYFT